MNSQTNLSTQPQPYHETHSQNHIPYENQPADYMRTQQHNTAFSPPNPPNYSQVESFSHPSPPEYISHPNQTSYNNHPDDNFAESNQNLYNNDHNSNFSQPNQNPYENYKPRRTYINNHQYLDSHGNPSRIQNQHRHLEPEMSVSHGPPLRTQNQHHSPQQAHSHYAQENFHSPQQDSYEPGNPLRHSQLSQEKYSPKTQNQPGYSQEKIRRKRKGRLRKRREKIVKEGKSEQAGSFDGRDRTGESPLPIPTYSPFNQNSHQPRASKTKRKGGIG